MKPIQQLHDLGQSLWLDNITRELLTDGTLRRYIDDRFDYRDSEHCGELRTLCHSGMDT